MSGALLSLGHGYSAQALAQLLLPAGWRIIGTTRTAEKAKAMSEQGIESVVWPGTDLTPHIETATHILANAAPTEEGDPFLPEIKEALKTKQIQWLGYLSTTGVYGDHQGGWVDETTRLTPATRRGRLRVEAETAWQTLAEEADLPLHIFRLAGIYGPGRGPFAKVRAGTARRIIKSGQVFSRIHVDDIAQVLAASIARPNPGAVYNLCDDDPAPPEDVIAFAAQLLGLPVPPAEDFAAAEMTPMARSFYAESKRVKNNRIKDELGIKLRYPDYRTGLRAMLETD